jgi:hypothetical protein
MYFLLRVAFWLTIVLALLPSGSKQPTTSGPQFGEAMTAAGAAVSDVRPICTRQPEACEGGAQTAVMIGQRAQAGAKMLYEMFNERTGSVPGKNTGPATSAERGTLTPADREPSWRGIERRKETKPSA